MQVWPKSTVHKLWDKKKQQSEIAFFSYTSFELFSKQQSIFQKTITQLSTLKVCHNPGNFIIHSIAFCLMVLSLWTTNMFCKNSQKAKFINMIQQLALTPETDVFD